MQLTVHKVIRDVSLYKAKFESGDSRQYMGNGLQPKPVPEASGILQSWSHVTHCSKSPLN